MRLLALGLPLLLVASPFLVAEAQLPAPEPLGVRTFVLVMEGTRFNLRSAPETPLLEAYAGELLQFTVAVPPTAEPHTFHLHGHPWLDADTGRFIDTKLLHPGDVHRFEVVAGGEDGHAGDWLYHCHMDHHMAMGMMGLLRVYPFGLDARATADGLDVRPVHEGRTLAGDVTLRVTLDGAPLDAAVAAGADGTRHVTLPPLAEGGEVVVTAVAGLGESVARFRATAAGLQPMRDVFPPR